MATCTQAPAAAVRDEDLMERGVSEFQSALASLTPEDWVTIEQQVESTDSAVLAWNGGPAERYRTYIDMFESTGDMASLQRTFHDFDIILSHRCDRLLVYDVVHEKIMAAWATSDETDPRVRCSVVNNGLIISPIARLIYLVSRNPPLYALCKERITAYLIALEQTIQSFEMDWRENEAGTEGWYWTEAALRISPFNQMHTMGTALVYLYLATGNTFYLHRVEQMAAYFQDPTNSGLHIEPDGGYLWLYRPGSTDQEDVGHAGLTIQFITACYKAGIAFTAADMTAFYKTWQRCLVPGATAADMLWTFFIDGTSVGYSPGLHSAYQWGGLGEFEIQVTWDTAYPFHGGTWGLYTAGYSCMAALAQQPDCVIKLPASTPVSSTGVRCTTCDSSGVCQTQYALGKMENNGYVPAITYCL